MEQMSPTSAIETCATPSSSAPRSHSQALVASITRVAVTPFVAKLFNEGDDKDLSSAEEIG